MTPRHLRTPLSRCRAALVGLVVVVVASCGTADGQVSAGQAPGQAPLPTLPSVAARHPGQFVDGGCAATSEGSDCSATAAQIDAAQAGATDDDWRSLAGFVGPDWSTTTTGSVVVLDDTVTTSTGGPWTATGLVRNQTASTVGPVVIEATLLDSAGQILDVVSGTVAVPSLRPGEPGPFSLVSEAPPVSQGPTPAPPTIDAPSTTVAPASTTAPEAEDAVLAGAVPITDDQAATTTSALPTTSTPGPPTTSVADTAPPPPAAVDATSVVSVQWRVRAEPLAEPPGRDLELSVFWQRGVGDQRPVDMYLHHDPPGAHPMVVFGTVTDVGDAPIGRTQVVGAWIDATGRVLALTRAEVGHGGQPVATVDLDPGSQADFVLVVDAASAPAGLDAASLVLWGTGS